MEIRQSSPTANAYPRTASLLTPVGRGAVATIQVVGNLGAAAPTQVDSSSGALDSLFCAANKIPLSQQPLRRIAFGCWGITDTEELVICRTAPNTLEIHCHGGDAAVQRILNDLSSAGCQLIDWRSQVALISDILEAECLEVLSKTTTWRTTEIALLQSNGLLRTAFIRLKAAAKNGNEAGLKRELNELITWSNFGLKLSTPRNVVLTGRPNVGKSSLINALLGYERSIVFDQPGTTRDVVTGETAFDGWPVVLADTAGLRDNAPELEAAGIALARERLRIADLHLVLIDTSQPPTIDDEKLLAEYHNHNDALIVAHKADLANRWGASTPPNSIKVSSATGVGVKELQKAMVSNLVPQIPALQTAIPITQRQVDLLREIRQSLLTPPGLQAIDRLFTDR